MVGGITNFLFKERITRGSGAAENRAYDKDAVAFLTSVAERLEPVSTLYHLTENDSANIGASFETNGEVIVKVGL